MLALVDNKHFEMTTAEKNLQTMSERMLLKVGAKFGKDSDQYEKAGGVRKSMHKKPAIKAVTSKN